MICQCTTKHKNLWIHVYVLTTAILKLTLTVKDSWGENILRSRRWHWRRHIKYPCKLSLSLWSASLLLGVDLIKITEYLGMGCLICFCVFAAIIIVALYLRKIHGFLVDDRAPPNLPSLPIIGSLLSIRSDSPPHIFFQQLQKKYGDIYSLMMGSNRVIIVNNHHHAKEVLLRKGKIFAGRPRTVSNLYQSQIPSKNFIHLCCYSKRWRT